MRFPSIGRAPAKAAPVAKEPTPEEALAQLLTGIANTLNGVGERLDRLEKHGSTRAAPAAKPASAPAKDETNEFDLGVDLSGLPDPVGDPEGFQKALGQRVSQTVQKGVGRAVELADSVATTRANRARTFDDMWADFQNQYPELAKFDDVLETQVRRMVAEGGKAGLTPDQVIFDDPKFASKVAARTEERLAQLGWQKPAEGEADGEADEPAGDDGRDMGFVFGGGKRPKAGAASEQDHVPTFVEQLQASQLKSGLWG